MLLDRSFLASLRSHQRAALLSILALFLLCLPTHAQTAQGALNGEVTDATGALIPGATVTATNTDTKVALKTKSNTSGVYVFTSLVPGPYTVDAVAPGFTRTVINQITVSAAQTVSTHIRLAVGDEGVTVNVESSDSLLSKDTSDVSTTVDHTLVEELPYPERSALEAALLVPGVNGDPTQPGGIASENPGVATSYVLPGANLTVGGSPPGTTTILIDGSDVLQASYPRSGLNLSGRNVGEVTVVTSGLSAKYGRTSSGAVSMSSAAGTSKYHGAITWRHTDPWFNATPITSPIKSNQRENYYGFYVSGPIRIPKLYNGRDRTFFSASFEPARTSNVNAQRATFFTPDELQGKFNDSLTVIDQSVLKASGWDAAVAAPRPTGLGVYKRSATYNANGFPTGATMSGNSGLFTGPLSDCSAAWRAANPSATVCPNDISTQLQNNAFGKFVTGLIPTPSNPGKYARYDRPDGGYASDLTNGYYERGVQNFDNRYNIRIDHKFNNSNQVFVRYTNIPIHALRFFMVDVSNPINQTPGDAAYSNDIALGYTRVLSNNVVNNFHYSFMRVYQPRFAPPATTTTDFAAKYGLTPATSGAGFPALGNFNTNGISFQPAAGVSNAQINLDQNFIVGDDVAWTYHRHQFQFGVDIRWIQSNQYDLSGETGGKYSFAVGDTASSQNGGTGGNALATFELGIISGFSNTPVEIPGYYRWRYYAGYFQDDWRALPSLTINIGARYEVETPRMEKFNNQAFLTSNYHGSVNGFDVNSAFCFSGACGLGKGLWPTNYWGIEPRVGISYAPTHKSTLRAGYAISRVPLTGQENLPDPNLNVPSSGLGGSSGGGLVAGSTVDYVSNPITSSNIKSAYTTLNGARGPFAFATGLAPVFVDQSSAVPYVQSWSLTYQYQPFAKTVFQASYQGVKGTHLYGGFNYARNTIPLGVYEAAVVAHKDLAINSNNTYLIRQNNNDPTMPIIQESVEAKLYPYQNFFNQTLPEIYPRRGTLHFNALYLSVNQRLTRDLSFLTTYSWTKSLDNVQTNAGFGGGFGVAPPQNPFDTRAELSASSFDQPSRFRSGYNYTLPLGFNKRFHFKSRILNQIVGGLSTSGIASINSGFPNYVGLGSSGYFQSITPNGVDGCTTANYCVTGTLPAGYNLRPNFVPGQPLINPNWKKNPFNSLAPGGITPYLNPKAFTIAGTPDNPQLGNVPRSMTNARSPREFFFDMRVAKDFQVYKKYRVNLNANFSNVFNHPAYFGVNGRNLYTTITPSASTGTFDTTSGINAAFGNLAAVNSQGVSRVVRFGAEINF